MSTSSSSAPSDSSNIVSSTADHRPLDGVTVLEISQWVAGPAAAGIMADWGAEVIKLEAPAGDPQRGVFAAVGIEKELPNPAFAQDNRGKRSVVFDLQTPEGLARCEQLLTQSDVFITNLRPDALQRLQLDPAAVSARHPELIIASLSGYGSVGPARDVPGYDAGAFWSRSGLARTNSPREDPPLFIRSGVGDHITGMATAMGVMAALYERTRTGKGRIVETSLFATGMYTAGWDLSVQLTMGRLSSMRSRTKSQTPMVNSYRSADDKWFFLIGLEAGRHFPGLAKAIGRPELAEDDRFGSAKSIFANAEALVTVLDEIFSEHPMSHWAPLFEANDVWWAPCQTMADVATDPQALALGLFIDTDDSAWDTAERVPPKVRTVASPATFDGQVFLPRRPVPSLGEHTAEVIAELDAT